MSQNSIERGWCAAESLESAVLSLERAQHWLIIAGDLHRARDVGVLCGNVRQAQADLQDILLEENGG